MTKIAKFDASISPAYLIKNFAAASTHVIEAVFNVPAATLSAMLADHGPGADIADLIFMPDDAAATHAGMFAEEDSGTWKWWEDLTGSPPTGTLTADTDFTMRWELTGTGTSWVILFKINGSTLFTETRDFGTGHGTSDSWPFDVGNVWGSTAVVGNIILCKSITVDGVTDDFASGGFISGGWTVVGDATVITPGAATPQYVPSFTVHNISHGGTAISELTPVGGSLKWTYRLAQVGGPGEAQWAVGLSDDSLTDPDQFAPYRTDWKITMHYPDEADEDLIAGIMNPVNTGSEDTGIFSEIRCSGLDWLHWLEQPWPFDYSGISASVAANQLNDNAGLFKIWDGATQGTIVAAMASALDGNTDAVIFTQSQTGTGWSLTLDKEIGFGDSTTVLDSILSVAQLGVLGSDEYGFDMHVDPDKTLHFVAPRITPTTGGTVIYTIDDSTAIVPPLDWTNNGPLETDTVVFGQTSNNTSRIGYSDYPASKTVYREWTQFQQVNLASEDSIASSAAAIGYQDRFPQKDLKVTIRPDLLDPADPRAGFRKHVGKSVNVHYPVSPYHTINADFWILEQSYYTDGCTWLCDLTLQQIYAADATPDD